MTIEQILSGSLPLDTAECEELRQFARDYAWSEFGFARIDDVDQAADHVIGELTEDIEDPSEAAVGVLRSALIDSADAHVQRVELGIEGYCEYCGHPIPVEGVYLEPSRDIDTSGAGRPRCADSSCAC